MDPNVALEVQPGKELVADAVSALSTWPPHSPFLLSGAFCKHL